MASASAPSTLPSAARSSAAAAVVSLDDDPLAYQDQLDFNTRRFPQYSHVIECPPPPGTQERMVRLCRCWQSKKFPYCDDTHKVLMEAGDNVGPFVAKLRGGFEDERRGRRGALQQSLSASQQQNAAVSPMIHASLFSKQETAFSSSNSPSSLADGVERIAFSPSRGGSAAAAVVHSTAAAAVLRSTAAAAVFPPAAVGVPSGRAGAAAAAACRFSAGDTLRRPSVALCRRGGMLSAAVTALLLGGAAVAVGCAFRNRRSPYRAHGEEGRDGGGAAEAVAAEAAAATAAAPGAAAAVVTMFS